MRILVLGAGGMAGHVVSLYLAEKGFAVDTLSATRPLDGRTVMLDATRREELEGFLEANRYDAIINCIGILIEESEARKDLSTYLNSFLPHQLEHLYSGSATRVVHLSTDCVFSGRNAPYYEDSPYDGELFYDRTKALGEIINDKDLTLRMSIIGPDLNEDGEGLFNWFSRQTGEISGYSNVRWNGITTIELAKGIEAALNQGLSGLYHLVPDTSVSKYELLQLFRETFGGGDVCITPRDDIIMDKTLVNTRQDFDFTVAGYPAMIGEMKEWIGAHSSLYGHYSHLLEKIEKR